MLEQHPPPHFRAIYGEYKAQVLIESGEIMGGELPRRARRMVGEWAELHRGELMENWRKAREGLPPDKIEPLP